MYIQEGLTLPVHSVPIVNQFFANHFILCGHSTYLGLIFPLENL